MMRITIIHIFFKILIKSKQHSRGVSIHVIQHNLRIFFTHFISKLMLNILLRSTWIV